MDNAAIAYKNIADLGLVTASSQEILMPGSRVQDPHTRRRWRSTGSQASLIFDLSTPVGDGETYDVIAFLGGTLSAASTVRVRASAVDVTGAAGELYDSGAIASGTLKYDAAYGCGIFMLPAALAGAYVRFDFDDSANPDAVYVEVGRVFIGELTEFEINFQFGWQRAWIDRSNRAETRGGQTLIWADNSYRTLDITFGLLSRTERDGIVETVDMVNGLRKDVLFITDPLSDNLPRDSIFGLLQNMTPVVNAQFVDVFGRQYQIKERL